MIETAKVTYLRRKLDSIVKGPFKLNITRNGLVTLNPALLTKSIVVSVKVGPETTVMVGWTPERTIICN